MTVTMLLCCLSLLAAREEPRATTVPLHVEHDRPFIDLEFRRADGSPRIARFWVDTGGGGFILGEKLARDIGCQIGTPVREGEEEYSPIAPPHARVGGMKLDLVNARCMVSMGAAAMFDSAQCEGLFPAHVLRRYRVTFDYPGRSFSLAAPGAQEARGEAIPAPIHGTSGFPRIELEIEGERLGFLLDTGASFTMISQVQLLKWSRAHADWPRTEGAVGRANMMGGAMEARGMLMRLPHVKLGSFVIDGAGAIARPPGTFEQYMSSMMTAPIVGAIGGNVLREFRVEIDYAGGKAYLTRTAERDAHDLDLVGLTLRRVAEGYAIDAVATQNDPGVRAAILPGDVLLQVDDLAVKGAALAAVVDALRGEPGDEHTLLIARGGKTFEVVAPVVRIL